ncbi:hypothetical protein EFT87_09695 [Schleiferilactobacillus harbinensis]|nr:hypothetical protein [Schleiferilactobacillus harbinensis]
MFWVAFLALHKTYSHADNSKLANQGLKQRLDKEAKQSGVSRKPVSTNDGLLQYAAFVYASTLAAKQLSERLTQTAKMGRKIDMAGTPDAKLHPKKLAEDIINESLDGTVWSERIWNNMEMLRASMYQQMQRTLILSENPIADSADLRKQFDVTAYQADRILRTEGARVMNAQQLENVRTAGYKRVKWIANTGACKFCHAHADEVYALEEADGILPAHPNCECSWAATDDSTIFSMGWDTNKIDWDTFDYDSAVARDPSADERAFIRDTISSINNTRLRRTVADAESNIRIIVKPTPRAQALFQPGKSAATTYIQMDPRLLTRSGYFKEGYEPHGEALIHELGHYIDSLNGFPSVQNRDVIRDTIHRDITKNFMYAHPVSPGLSPSKLKAALSDNINKALEGIYQNHPATSYSDLNDILSSDVAFYDIPPKTGHRVPYWINSKNRQSAEVFADLFSVKAINPKGYALIQEYLPDPYCQSKCNSF